MNRKEEANRLREQACALSAKADAIEAKGQGSDCGCEVAKSAASSVARTATLAVIGWSLGIPTLGG